MMKHKFNSKLIQDEQIKNLYDMAKSVAIPKVINGQMSSGGVGAAILTKQGNIYTGVCIDTDCSLGMCAERNALSTMITNGEYDVEMIIAVTKVGKIIPPCGACREFMWQLKNSRDIKVVLDNEETVANLEDLMPYPY
ncbi:cytidine deaminase [uncultured Eubacterium sp.]|uniref:cytidine deaminase family protein n=1 Tax=uncultured Eubacterium sp. TaxID=165185 RepID=UPI0025F330D7|nr:cytidine deaminase [uncultured Eubacterium sp.]